MKSLFSVCMPNYNCEKYISEAIDSVLSQTYGDFELIIVDDASTDRSVEIINNYNDQRIKFYRNETNLKMTANINKSLSLAEGKLITILHSDDKYAPNFLEEIVKNYNFYPEYSVFVTGVYNLHQENQLSKPNYPFKSGGIKSKRELLIRLANQNNIGNGINLVIRKHCLDKIGRYYSNYSITPDFDFLTRLANEFDFVYIPELLTYYRIHDSNITHNDIEKPDRYKIGCEVFARNILESKLIPKKIHNNLYYIAIRTRLNKTFRQGVAYKSGKFIRFVFNQAKVLYPGILFEPNWYIVYLLSFLIIPKTPRFIIATTSLLGRLILYPQKVYVNYLLEKLVREANNEEMETI